MTSKRRKFGESFKARVALAAVRGDRTTAQLAGKFGVHGNQVSSWKRRLLEGAAELFADGRARQTGCTENEGRRLEGHACPRRAPGLFNLQNATPSKPTGAAWRGVLQEAQ